MKKSEIENQIIGQVTLKGKQTAQVFDTSGKRAARLEYEIERHVQARKWLEMKALALYTGFHPLQLPGWLKTAKMKATEHQEVALIRDRLNRKHRIEYLQMIAELRRLFQIREYTVNNLIVTVGRSVLAQRLANTTTYTGIINYGALGSDNTAVANGDTTLGTEVFRKVTASDSYTDSIAFIDFFYSKADTNGTYEEFGTFIDGTASVDTGQMFTHALTGGWVKTASESMTVAAQYTIT